MLTFRCITNIYMHETGAHHTVLWVPRAGRIKLAEAILFPREIQSVICVDLNLDDIFIQRHNWAAPWPPRGQVGKLRWGSGVAAPSTRAGSQSTAWPRRL